MHWLPAWVSGPTRGGSMGDYSNTEINIVLYSCSVLSLHPRHIFVFLNDTMCTLECYGCHWFLLSVGKESVRLGLWASALELQLNSGMLLPLHLSFPAALWRWKTHFYSWKLIISNGLLTLPPISGIASHPGAQGKVKINTSTSYLERSYLTLTTHTLKHLKNKPPPNCSQEVLSAVSLWLLSLVPSFPQPKEQGKQLIRDTIPHFLLCKECHFWQHFLQEAQAACMAGGQTCPGSLQPCVVAVPVPFLAAQLPFIHFCKWGCLSTVFKMSSVPA